MRLDCLLTFFVFLFTFSSSIQSQDFASDWTATDINGVDHHFQDYIDAGKHVVIDFSATWCPPCWSYHQSGTLDHMWDLYGPDGTDEIMIFYLESDFGTNLNCLYGSAGCNDSSMGNWVAGTPYPIINLTPSNGGNVWSSYGISGFPTVSVISANNQTYYNLVGNGASSQSTLESFIFQSFPMEVSASVLNSNCGGDGQISASSTSGAGNINYSWSNGASGQVISDLIPGDYTVSATDANGYTVSETYTVGGVEAPMSIFAEEVVDLSCNGDASGAIIIEVEGGSGGYVYDWDIGLSGPELFGLDGGEYSVVVTDNNNCTITETFVVEEPNALTMVIDSSPEECDGGNASIQFFVEGGVGAYTYTVGSESNNNGYFSSLSAGVYDVFVEDGNACVTSEVITIENIPVPEAMANAFGSISCTENTVLISGEGSSLGNVNYEWSTTDGNILGDVNDLDIMVDAGGLYTLLVVDNETGCQNETEIMIEENTETAQLTSMVSGSIDCFNSEVILEGTSNLTGANMEFVWTTLDGNIISGEGSLVATVNAGGTYTLSATNTSNGCMSESSVTVEQNSEMPSVTTSSEILTCDLITTDLCADISIAGSTATWSYNGTSTDGLCINATEAGVYTVLVTAPNGCTVSTEHTVEASNDTPQITLDQPESLTCTVSSVMVSGQVDGDASQYSFLWTDAVGNVIGTELSTTVTSGGLYQLSVVNNTTGCSSLSMTTVEESDDLPEVNIPTPAELTCQITSVMITADVVGDPNDFNFTWGDDEEETIGMMQMVMVTEPGQYSVTVEEKATGCTSIQMATVTEVRNDPVSDYQVENENGTLNLGSTSMGSPISMVWTANGVEVMDITNLTFAENGTYEICLTVTNDCGSDTKCSDYVYAVALETTDLLSDISCHAEADGSITLSPTGGEGNYSVEWTGPNGFASMDLTIDGLEAGEYNMILSDSYGYEISGNYSIAEPTAIDQGSTIVNDETSEGASDGSVSFSAFGGAGTLSYLWSNGDTGSSLSGVPAGDYTVEVTDENGCTKTFGPFTIQLMTGVEDISFASALSLYPNPTIETLFIDIQFVKSVNVKVNITDAFGRLIESRHVTGNGTLNFSVDVTNYDSGIYFFEITDGMESTTEKFMVIK